MLNWPDYLVRLFYSRVVGLHPAIKILALLVMAALIQRLTLTELTVLGSLLFGTLIYFRVQAFVSMFWRMRWLFISMAMIYAYATPGEYLPNWPMDVAPTYEGLRGAAYQIVRISSVLAGIAILMATTTREVLMAGIYVLIRPLRYLGLSPERFTARLYLTLRYLDERANAQSKLEAGTAQWTKMLTLKLDDLKQDSVNETIRLDLPRLALLDYFSIIIIVCLVLITL